MLSKSIRLKFLNQRVQRHCAIYSSTSLSLFSTVSKQQNVAANTMKNEVLADWQYVAKIQQLLKQNNINGALKYLINSNLEGKVLDRHIFRNYFTKVHEGSMPISYQQMGYKLYRQHFKPHILVLQWMNSLTKSNSQNIIKMLKDDYSFLKMEMPTSQKINEQAQNTKIAQQNTAQNKTKQDKKQLSQTKQQQKKQPNTNNSAKKSQKQVSQQQDTNSQLIFQDQMKQRLLPLVKKLNETFISLNPSIVLHNVQIKYADSQQKQYFNQLNLSPPEQILLSQQEKKEYQKHKMIQQFKKQHNIKEEYQKQPKNMNNIQQQHQMQGEFQQEEQQYEHERLQKITIQRIQISSQGIKASKPSSQPKLQKQKSDKNLKIKQEQLKNQKKQKKSEPQLKQTSQQPKKDNENDKNQ